MMLVTDKNDDENDVNDDDNDDKDDDTCFIRSGIIFAIFGKVPFEPELTDQQLTLSSAGCSIKSCWAATFKFVKSIVTNPAVLTRIR